MGDRWRPSLLGSSRYIWLPLSWASGTPQLVQADVWTLDLNAGKCPLSGVLVVLGRRDIP